jgi:hypothetical protein
MKQILLQLVLIIQISAQTCGFCGVWSPNVVVENNFPECTQISAVVTNSSVTIDFDSNTESPCHLTGPFVMNQSTYLVFVGLNCNGFNTTGTFINQSGMLVGTLKLLEGEQSCNIVLYLKGMLLPGIASLLTALIIFLTNLV